MEIYKSIKLYLENTMQCINLVASENILPEAAKLPYHSELLNRYVMKNSKQLYFPGRDDLYKIEQSCCDMVAKLLDAQHVSLKPISGLNAMTCAIAIFTKPGDVVYSINPKHGGHHVTRYMLENMGRISHYIPFNESKREIDLEILKNNIISSKPSLIYIDIMNVLHDIDVTQIKKLIDKKTYLIYDASHVMALIMGKCYRNPLKCGADILLGTTHKTIPGPHKAIFATNNPILYRMFELRNGAFISSQHPADVYALGIVLEGMKNSMQEYAENIIKNARKLAELLDDLKLPVVHTEKGYTDTHQLWIGARNIDVHPFIDKLIKYRIVTNGLEIPYIGNFGIRIGVQEVTFCGFREREIEELADCIGRIYIDTNPKVDSRIDVLINAMNELTYFKPSK